MRRLTGSLWLLASLIAFCLVMAAFPSDAARVTEVTPTPSFFVYLPCVVRSAGPSPTPTATGTPSPTPTITYTPTATRTATPTAMSTPSGANVSCNEYAGSVQICAWVSNGDPSQYTTVTVYGRLMIAGSPVTGVAMHTVWHYKTTAPTEDCATGSDGIGRCSRNIGGATKGYTVTVDVTITHQGSAYSASTRFTPR